MELKYMNPMATIFLLYLLLLHLPRLSTCDGGDKANGEAEDPSTEEVYQIDYRGPETHPVFPFPSRGRTRFHPEHPNSKPSPRAKDSKSKVDRVRG